MVPETNSPIPQFLPQTLEELAKTEGLSTTAKAALKELSQLSGHLVRLLGSKEVNDTELLTSICTVITHKLQEFVLERSGAKDSVAGRLAVSFAFTSVLDLVKSAIAKNKEGQEASTPRGVSTAATVFQTGMRVFQGLAAPSENPIRDQFIEYAQTLLLRTASGTSETVHEQLRTEVSAVQSLLNQLGVPSELAQVMKSFADTTVVTDFTQSLAKMVAHGITLTAEVVTESANSAIKALEEQADKAIAAITRMGTGVVGKYATELAIKAVRDKCNEVKNAIHAQLLQAKDELIKAQVASFTPEHVLKDTDGHPLSLQAAVDAVVPQGLDLVVSKGYRSRIVSNIQNNVGYLLQDGNVGRMTNTCLRSLGNGLTALERGTDQPGGSFRALQELDRGPHASPNLQNATSVADYKRNVRAAFGHRMGQLMTNQTIGTGVLGFIETQWRQIKAFVRGLLIGFALNMANLFLSSEDMKKLMGADAIDKATDFLVKDLGLKELLDRFEADGDLLVYHMLDRITQEMDQILLERRNPGAVKAETETGAQSDLRATTETIQRFVKSSLNRDNPVHSALGVALGPVMSLVNQQGESGGLLNVVQPAMQTLLPAWRSWVKPQGQ